MAEYEGRCMKCQKNVPIQDAEKITTKNGRNAAKGKCGTCGTTVMRFLPKDA